MLHDCHAYSFGVVYAWLYVLINSMDFGSLFELVCFVQDYALVWNILGLYQMTLLMGLDPFANVHMYAFRWWFEIYGW